MTTIFGSDHRFTDPGLFAQLYRAWPISTRECRRALRLHMIHGDSLNGLRFVYLPKDL